MVLFAYVFLKREEEEAADRGKDTMGGALVIDEDDDLIVEVGNCLDLLPEYDQIS